ncbi:PHYKPL isoform 5, partial [Pan troglodytes]
MAADQRPRADTLALRQRLIRHAALWSPRGTGQPPFLRIQETDVATCRNEQGGHRGL